MRIGICERGAFIAESDSDPVFHWIPTPRAALADNAGMASLVHHAKVGRNDPCPCGSNKKYKRCCFSSQHSVEDSGWQRQRVASDSLTDDMMAFARKRFGDEIFEAWMDFNQSDVPPPMGDDFSERQVFFPYFLFDWNPSQPTTPRGKRPKPGIVAQEYMLVKSRKLSSLEELILTLSIAQPVSFYEVLHCDPGHGMSLRDILIGGVVEVEEHKGSQHVQTGDILYGQLCPLPDVITLSRMAPFAIPPGKKAAAVALRAQLRRKIAKQQRELAAQDLIRYREMIRTVYLDIRDSLRRPPKLQNTDGDPFVFHMLTFEIGSPQVAFDALASLAWGESKEDLLEGAEMAADGALLNISFDWRKKGNAMHKTWDNTILGHMKIAGRTLTVEVNSAQRAGRIHAEIDRRLGILARHQGTVSQTPEQLLATKKQSKQFLPSLAKPDRDDSNIESETLETVRASMRQEMEDWVDLKLPVLGGRTPRQAVQEPDGREIVEGILLEWERSAAQPSVAKFINPDVSIIRRLLHLQG